MNWDAISAGGEIVGAVAIIVTLFYLAAQMRQNTRSIQLSALHATMGKWNEWSSTLATSPDLADIVARGNQNPHSLNTAEALRYGAYIQMFFDAVETYYDQISDIGIRGDEGVLSAIVKRRMALSGIVQWWQENKGDYDAEFQVWIATVTGNHDE